MRIVWDEPKRLTNLQKRQLDFRDLSLEFFSDAIAVPAKQGRLKAIGLFQGSPLTVIFRPLGSEALAVISMRRANRQERRLL